MASRRRTIADDAANKNIGTSVKHFAKRMLRRLGFDIVRTGSTATLAVGLSELLKTRAIDCVFDVGANKGRYGRLLRDIGYRGRIVSFEPVADTFAELQAAARGDPDWHCHPVALGRRRERRTINVYRNRSLSSFLEPNGYARDRWPSYLERTAVETVQVERLDEFARDIAGQSCLLKTDTQGLDAEVFAGAEGILDRVAVLQSELSVIQIYEDMPDWLEMLRLLRDSGFYPAGLFPINRDASGATVEFDCLLVRRG